MRFDWNWNLILEFVFLTIVLMAVRRNSSNVDHAITSLAPNVYAGINLLEGGSGSGVWA